MLVYQIKQGVLRSERNGVRWTGLYSGDAEHRNDPLATNLKEHGPIPVGVYWIGKARDSKEHGPMFIPLLPVPGVELYGRGGFGVHGDRIGHVGEYLASKGCIIAQLHIREEIENHKLLIVMSGAWEEIV
jgi:hypothetical protein